MARTTNAPRGARNTAPMWKKITLIVVAFAVPVAIIRLTGANTWNFFPFAAVVVASAAIAIWLTAKVIGVRLSLGNWDDAPPLGRR